jgi:hypothetical protein
MSTIKLEHVPLLKGASNYPEWSRLLSMTLHSNSLWGHVQGDTDKTSPWRVIPKPEFTSASKDSEYVAYKNWYQEDSKAREMLERRMVLTVRNHLSQDPMTTSRELWESLRDLYARTDVASQFQLKAKVASFKLKDSSEVDKYLSDFASARQKFKAMNAVYTEEEAVYGLIHGLPSSSSWESFKQLLVQTVQHYDDTTESDKRVKDALYNRISQRIVAECMRLDSMPSGKSSASTSAPRDRTSPDYANVTSEIRRHTKNPNGVKCTNCGGTSHDKEHCWSQGGGCEGQGPKGRKHKSKDSVSGVPETASLVVPGDDCWADLSCASIEFAIETAGSAILDSGATSHLIKDRSLFWSYDPSEANVVKTANHGTLRTNARGDCVALLKYKGQQRRLRLRGCLHAPDAIVNLLSVGRMTSAGLGCNFAGSKCVISSLGGSTVIGIATKHDGLFFVDMEFLPCPDPAVELSSPPNSDVACFAKVPQDVNLWHARMGHPGKGAIRLLPAAVSGVQLAPTSITPFQRCEPCIIAKHVRAPYPPSGSRCNTLLGLIHCDICGPMPVRTPHGKLYFIVFLDDKSNSMSVELLATKGMAFQAWLDVKARWELKTGLKVLAFRCDNAKELISCKFNDSLALAGIERQFAAPYAHQQNGKAERAIRTLEEHTLAMITSAGLPLNMWGEAVLTAAYLLNRSVTRTLPANVTPYEMFNGRKPDLSHVRVWGCRCFARIPSELQTKLGVKSRECIFVGYPPGSKAYRVRDCKTNTFFIARDVIFDENIAYRGLHDPGSSVSVSLPSQSVPLVDSSPCHSPVTDASSHVPAAPSAVSLPGAPPPCVRPSRSRIPTPLGIAHRESMLRARAHLEKCRALRASRLAADAPIMEPAPAVDGSEPPLASALGEAPDGPSVLPDGDVAVADASDDREQAHIVCNEVAMLTIRCETRRNLSDSNYNLRLPPATYEEALLRPDAHLWKEAMDKELDTMLKMGVYSVVECPEDRKQVGCRWVLEFKVADLEELLYKARLVAKGFSQIPHVDFGATFAPVTKTSSVRLVLAIANRMDWEIDCFDATRAFLWGDLQEELYMRLPKGFQGEGGPGKCWRLWKSIYGLKQASNVWYKKLKGVLVNMGFTVSSVDHALFRCHALKVI